LKFFSYHQKVIEPLVSSKTLRILGDHASNSSDNQLELIDTQGAPCVSQPKTIVRGTMRSYQLKGLEWLLHMFDQGMSPILGDEMGLGKTLQTISFLAALKERNIGGPHLVVVPLSVMSSWLGEFRKWCPSLRVVRIHTTDRAERERLRKDVLSDIRSYDVALTTYEYLLVPEMRHALYSRVTWRCVVLDEGHKVKNENSLVSQAVRKLKTECVVLLTGT
jgi:SWI/SNF-related matrix-associated actin-dependent regulator of chromatin subfamily A member 5